MTSDLRERERALDPAQSFIVQAPAGSGKTGLLTQRFLRLLSVVDRPESIVAVTFTRKAAAEMRNRVFDALTAAAAGSPVKNDFETRTRQLATDALVRSDAKSWKLLVDPGRLQIHTIDALCAMLTHQMPVISGFGGETAVLEDATDLYRAAARRTLRVLTEGDESSRQLFRSVILYFDNNTSLLEDQITRMLEKRDQWAFLRSGEHPELVDRFCHLLEKARESLAAVFRECGCVDFSESTQAAIRALGTPERPSDLLYSLDYRIEHLLVDEFQDTSRAQYHLVQALTAQWSGGDNHTLFLVGDPMQSIYRFREAEVSLFLQCWDTQLLGSVQLERVSLDTNFRCTPEILAWVEDKFSRLMLADDQFESAVQFRRSRADRAAGAKAPGCNWFIDDDGAREAASVVELVASAHAKGTVAILVRSRSHIVDILPALRKADIEYEAVEIDRLTDQQHVIDIVALTRAIQHVADRVSWLACLRAPWCGLCLADLSALAEHDPERNIIELLSDPLAIARLSSDGRQRALRCEELLSAAVQNAGRVPLRDLVKSTWVAFGGPAILASANQREDVDTVLALIESQEQGGVIRDFSLLRKRMDKLYAKPAAGHHRVQVMTIYEAKGLEFDTVILPQLSKETRKLDKDLLIWTEGIDAEGNPQFRLAAMPQSGEEDPEYREIRDAIKKKEEHELKRVFYVACTRAKNELFLLANNKSRKDGRGCHKAKNGTFLNLIWDSVKPEFEDLARRSFRLTALPPTVQETPKTILRRLPTGWRLPMFDASVDWQPELRAETASSRPVTYEWVKGNARHIGTVVHKLLNQVIAEGLENWGGARVRSTRALISSELLMRGVPRNDERDATEKVMAAIGNALETSRGRWILSPHAESRSEFPVRGRIQDELITGTVDRIFRDETGRLWIIDYKTGEHKGGSREAFLNEEQRRYRSQLDNYAILISRLEAGPISLGLYFPLLDSWREWEFAQEAALTA